MGRRNTLIFFVLVAALILIGFAVTHRTAEDELAISVERPKPLLASAVEPPESGGRKATELEVPPPPTPEVSAAGEAKSATEARVAAANLLYQDKYRDFSKDQLLVASHALHLKVKSETARITKEILASGDMESHVMSAGETPPGIVSSKESPVTAGVFQEVIEPDGSHIWSQRDIDAKNYPEYHALLLEELWVTSEVMHLDRLGK